jgi:hypothetical protein
MIAFCFLVYDNIIRYDIWNDFFKEIDPNRYTLFIHPKNIVNHNLYTFQYTYVKNIVQTVSKDDISIVRATLQLFKEVHENNKEISHILFLSQSCIPLYPFDKIDEIVQNMNKSVVSYILNNKKERYHQLHHQIKKYISFHHFVKQQPNMILIRKDVEDLLKFDYTLYFDHMQCPDEHYFINVLIHILKKKVIKGQTHFCNYDLHKTQALDFYHIDQTLINTLRNHGFLFMRKVHHKSYVDKDYLN